MKEQTDIIAAAKVDEAVDKHIKSGKLTKLEKRVKILEQLHVTMDCLYYFLILLFNTTV